MKIIKRNGAEESFDTLKIVNAVQKACNATENAYLAPEQLTDIADYVEYKCNKLGRAVSVEEIQDMVENQLMAIGAFAIAKNYVRYRYDRSLVRKANTTDNRILSLIECNNEEVMQENSNKNPTVNSVQRDYWLAKSARISREDFFFRKILLRRISRESSTSMTPTILHSICTTAIL